MGRKLTAFQSSEISKEIFSAVRLVPVLSIAEIDNAIPLARALAEGGLKVLEVTLRTPNALAAVKKMSQVENVIVGVGTLLNRAHVESAIEIGAKFGVSPGITDELVDACEENGLPLLAGVSSASGIMRMLDRGYDFLKFFPAEASGGIRTLRAFEGPLPQVSFCPTGGISITNVEKYLELKNVVCVGGSWMATPAMIKKKQWEKITQQAEAAARLGC